MSETQNASTPTTPKEKQAQREQALEKWQKAQAFAKRARWESAVKVGEKALALIDDIDDELYGDWSRPLLEWKVRSGDPDAMKRAGYSLFFGRMMPRRSIFFLLGLLLLLSAPLLFLFLKKGDLKHLLSSRGATNKQQNMAGQLQGLLNDKSEFREQYQGALNFFKSTQERREQATRALSKTLLQTNGDKAGRALEALYQLVRTTPNASKSPVTSTIRKYTDAHQGHYNIQNLRCRKETQLTGIELSEAQLLRAQLPQANLTNANLTKSVLRDANLVGAKLDGANLEYADLTNAKIKDASFKNTRFVGAFIQADQANTLRAKNVNLDNAHCFSGLGALESKQFAQQCYRWYRFPKQRKQTNPPTHCPKVLRGPIIAYKALSQEGRCQWLQTLKPVRAQPLLIKQTTPLFLQPRKRPLMLKLKPTPR